MSPTDLHCTLLNSNAVKLCIPPSCRNHWNESVKEFEWKPWLKIMSLCSADLRIFPPGSELSLMMWCFEISAMKQTVSILCQTRLLPGVPLGHLSFFITAVIFTWPQTVTRSGQTGPFFWQIPRKVRCKCEGFRGKYECWWVCHLWICSSKWISGPESSNLWTENLKPTDS